MEDRKQKGIILGRSDPNCSDEEYLDSLPPGFRFVPTDEALIVDYLSKKIKGMLLPPNRIRVIKVYDFHPGYLFETCKPKREKEVYFFMVREKKYENGHRLNRVTVGGDGYWRASQKEPIFSSANGRKVGDRRSLAYHEFVASRESKRCIKTHWLMHEYSIGDNLDEWVVCKIYKGPKKDDRAPQPTYDLPNEADTKSTIPSGLPSSEIVIYDDSQIRYQIESDHPTNSGPTLAPQPISVRPTVAPLGAFDATDPGYTLAPLPTSLDPILETSGAIDRPGATLAPLPDSLSVQSYERVQSDDVTMQNILDWYHANGASGLEAYDQSIYRLSNKNFIC